MMGEEPCNNFYSVEHIINKHKKYEWPQHWTLWDGGLNTLQNKNFQSQNNIELNQDANLGWNIFSGFKLSFLSFTEMTETQVKDVNLLSSCVIIWILWAVAKAVVERPFLRRCCWAWRCETTNGSHKLSRCIWRLSTEETRHMQRLET